MIFTISGHYFRQRQRVIELIGVPRVSLWEKGDAPETIYRVSQEECARLRETVPYVKLYRYNPKHLYPELNGYGDNGQ